MAETQKARIKRIAVVYMVAGLSSRFGEKIKQFAQVGPNGETLIEISMNQAIKAGFNEIVFVVGEKTERAFKEKFNAIYRNVPVYYAMQSFDPSERDKPWGSCDALVSAKDAITGPFVVCNGDDLYGENSFRKAREFLERTKEDKRACVAIGYTLSKVLTETAPANRAIFSVDKENFVLTLNEIIGIEKSKLDEKKLKESDLCSMNLFGLKEETLKLLEVLLAEFKLLHKGDRKSECYLPIELGNLVKEKKITMKLLPTSDEWFGVTIPEDEGKIKTLLAKKTF